MDIKLKCKLLLEKPFFIKEYQNSITLSSTFEKISSYIVKKKKKNSHLYVTRDVIRSVVHLLLKVLIL